MLFNNSVRYIEEDTGSQVIDSSNLLSELSLFSSYCVPVSVMALIRIRILSNDLNEECLMQELLTEFGAGFRNKQGIPRQLQTCPGKTKQHQHLEFDGKRIDTVLLESSGSGIYRKGASSAGAGFTDRCSQKCAAARSAVPKQGRNSQCTP